MKMLASSFSWSNFLFSFFSHQGLSLSKEEIIMVVLRRRKRRRLFEGLLADNNGVALEPWPWDTKERWWPEGMEPLGKSNSWLWIILSFFVSSCFFHVWLPRKWKRVQIIKHIWNLNSRLDSSISFLEVVILRLSGDQTNFLPLSQRFCILKHRKGNH